MPSSIREVDRTGKTALHYCAENPTLNCLEQLVQTDESLVNVQDEEGYTPLHLAVISGNNLVIKYLLSKNADITLVDNEGHSVVHWATVCGELEALDLLLSVGANPSTSDIHGAFPIHYSAQMCGSGGELGGDPRLGLAVLKRLLVAGVDVSVTDQDGRQPLLWAASADSWGNAGWYASGSADAMLALVNAGAQVDADDKDGLTALHCAASRGHVDCIETLVSLCGANVEMIDSNGCTALFYAVTLGHADCTELLLKYKSEPNRQDRKGRTPAHCGAAKGQLETLKLLEKHGANLWLKNVKGDYPLQEAVLSGRKDLVKWLLQQWPQAVNANNNDGRCPIHVAALNNNMEMCKVLMDMGANINAVMRSNRGQLMTALDAALYRGNRGCAKYLQLHGGVPSSKLAAQGQLQIPEHGNSFSSSLSPDIEEIPLSSSSLPAISPNALMAPVNPTVLQQQNQGNNNNNNGLVMPTTHQEALANAKNVKIQIRIKMRDQEDGDSSQPNSERKNKGEQYVETQEHQSQSETVQEQRVVTREERETKHQKERHTVETRSKQEKQEKVFDKRSSKVHTKDHSSKEKERKKHREAKHRSISESDEEQKEEQRKEKTITKTQQKSSIEEDSYGDEEELSSSYESDVEATVNEHRRKKRKESKHKTRVDSTSENSKRTKKRKARRKRSQEERTSESEEQSEERSEESQSSKDSGKNSSEETRTTKTRSERKSAKSKKKNRKGSPPTYRVKTNSVTIRKPKKVSAKMTKQRTRPSDDEYDEVEIIEETVSKKVSWSKETVNDAAPPEAELQPKVEQKAVKNVAADTQERPSLAKLNSIDDGSDISAGEKSSPGDEKSESSIDGLQLLKEVTTEQESRRAKSARRLKSAKRVETLDKTLKTSVMKEEREEDTTVVETTTRRRRVYRSQAEQAILSTLQEVRALQSRSGGVSRPGETVHVKRMVESLKTKVNHPAFNPYTGPLTFRGLYNYLNKLPETWTPSSDDEPNHLNNLALKLDSKVLPKVEGNNVTHDPKKCTSKTYRCSHAAHAYTGVPCVAYITRPNHHQQIKAPPKNFLPVIENYRKRGRGRGVVPFGLRNYDPKKPLTLELNHAGQKQKITFPTDGLDSSRRYHVTFTIKPTTPGSGDDLNTSEKVIDLKGVDDKKEAQKTSKPVETAETTG